MNRLSRGNPLPSIRPEPSGTTSTMSSSERGHIYMGGADVIEGKSHISLFAAYKGVNHVRRIAFDIQEKPCRDMSSL